MTQWCYKTHKEDPQNFQNIDAVSISQLLRGNTKGISNQYLNATRVIVIGNNRGCGTALVKSDSAGFASS